jgi:hypothetical protein
MNRKYASVFMLCALVALVAGCSGLPVSNGGGGGGGTGNANVTLTVFDAPPAGVDFVSFTLPISSVTLTPQSGAPVNVFSPSNAQVFELTHLQSDSALLGTFQIPANTYTAINVFVRTPSSIFANSSTTTFGNCPPATVCNLNGGGDAQLTFTFATPLALAGNQNVGLGLEINLANAITSSGNAISIDMTQPNVLAVVSLPRTGQTAGTLDDIDDFVGIVTAVSGSSITLQNDAGISLTGTTGSSTTFDPPPGGSASCGGTFNLACVAVGQTLSVDATVSTSGSITLTNVDFLDLPAADEIEGTIFNTTTPGTFLMVVDHKVLAASSNNATILGPVSAGFTLNIILDTSGSGPIFAVDTSNLPIAPTVGFLSGSDLVTGQRIMAHVKSVTSGTLLNVTTDRVVLRFSRFTGTPGAISGSIFTLQSPPSFLNLNIPPEVNTFIPQTIFDGITDISGLNGVATPVSIRALYLNPNSGVQQPLLAAKVRKH